jgi:uncharacterized protein (DUF885 family)
MKVFLKTSLIVVFLAAVSCKESPAKSSEISEAQQVTASQKVNDFLDEKFKENVMESPMMQTRLGYKTDYDKWDDISPTADARDLARAKERLLWITDSVDVAALNEATLLSYTLYKERLEHQIADYQYRLFDYPVNQMHGMQAEIPAFLINMHTVTFKEDAEAYIARLVGLESLFSQLVANLKERAAAGIVPPKFVFDHVINDAKNLIKGAPFDSNPPSTLMADITEKVNALKTSEGEKKALLANAREALLNHVKPAYEALITYLELQKDEASDDDGVWKWPNGEAFYANALQRTTTTKMSSDEIHNLGLAEVKRIHEEMNAIKDRVGFEGSLQAFFKELKENEKFYYPQSAEGKAAYMNEATRLIDEMKTKLDAMFITKPKAAMVVKAVEGFREKSAGKAFYQRPAIDGSRPGTYYANMYKMKMMPKYQMEALAFHEGIPGHHMQIAIAQELKDVPKFRKFGGYTAYIEGWGLYSEYLPKEFGFYKDPYSDFGRLAMELWRSCRLVVDTGIHSKKWTRQQGIDYYAKNTPNDMLDCIKMVERHIVMPSQATAYKIGMNKILSLRQKAQDALGTQFDIRKFHEVILANGALPLEVLALKVDEMIAATKK